MSEEKKRKHKIKVYNFSPKTLEIETEETWTTREMSDAEVKAMVRRDIKTTNYQCFKYMAARPK